MTSYVDIKAKAHVYVKKCKKSVDNELEAILESMMDKISSICEVDKVKDIDIDSDDSFSVTFDLTGDGREIHIQATRLEPSEYELETDLYEISSVLNQLDFAEFDVSVEIIKTEKR